MVTIDIDYLLEATEEYAEGVFSYPKNIIDIDDLLEITDDW
ncbi:MULTISPECIES: hypothetical protein [Bacillaceae]|uniref:Uncharacterized protein n=1 Tax=Peribacillus huizhouensis TaxID=1501239 RepID=A0ABR6CPS9_9BACI|nr:MULTISPECIES: hypothetical protein [Bacillaceae]MBA9027047.1 hypothetical protein [Peribacillus huizhouensis]